MKILLSAYACEPDKGSEPGIGWNWAIELARLGHEVWVLTRANNKASIEAVSSDCEEFGKLNFLYYDLPTWARWWKKGGRGIRFYYLLWQVGAYRIAKHMHREMRFDLVHHITFGLVRQPSFMGGLGIPFIFGPVAGGERAPWKLRFGYGIRGWLLDGLRDMANSFVKFDPFMWYTFRKATKIYATSEQTRNLIPSIFRNKTCIQLAIGWDGNNKSEGHKEKDHIVRVLYVGRFLYWKGLHLGLAAFAKLLESIPNARFTLVGKGSEEKKWKKLVDKLDITDNVDWVSWVDQNNLTELYQQHNVFLFPSLHDSGGMVVLEAMSFGLPVICLDLGGPGVMVNETCGYKINTIGCPETKVVDSLSDALIKFFEDAEQRKYLIKGALKRANEINWRSLVKSVYVDFKV